MCRMTPSSGLAQLRRGTVEFCVLALLRRNSTYGFDLVRKLSEASGPTSEGTVYPVLSRLRRSGLVTTHWQPSDEGPPRRYYTITEQGESALGVFAIEWDQFRSSIDAVLTMGEVRS